MKKNLLVSIFLIISTAICLAQDVGDKAPEFSFPTLDHGRLSLSDFKGKVTYIFLLGYNCPPCVSEGPIVEKQIHQKYKNQNFQAIGIDVWDGSINQMLTYKEQTGISFPLCLIGSSVLPIYKLTYDYSIVIDQDGFIQYLGSGVHTEQIKAIIENLLSYSSLDNSNSPKDFELNQNYPNPFNPSTLISFILRKPQYISLKIYNEKGRLINSLFNNDLTIGRHEYLWDGKNYFGKIVPSGIYFSVLQGRDFRDTKKMLLVY
jgi:thiol-disulfide isomerase/thioredoxin